METTAITVSQLADLIIVACFFIAAYVAFLYIIGEAVSAVIDIIKEKRRVRKERKAKKLEQEQAKEQEA